MPLSPTFGGGPLTRNTSFGSNAPLPSHFSARISNSPSLPDAPDPEEQARNHLIQAMEVTQNADLKLAIQHLLESWEQGMLQSTEAVDATTEVYRTVVSMEDFLWKKGKSIGFTMRASLKAKGLIPRANGTRRVSKKYN